MDQSKSSEKNAAEQQLIAVPKRKLTLEFFVGLFALVSFAAVGYLAVGLGGLEIGTGNHYLIDAEFDNISGLKAGASVEIAGVKVGDVVKVSLDDPMAITSIRIINSIKIRDDDIFSIRTKGIIGDRYVKISRGASDTYIEPGGRVIETESVVDIEDIIGKFVHSLEGNDDE